jgi:hypothetical protein
MKNIEKKAFHKSNLLQKPSKVLLKAPDQNNIFNAIVLS